MVKYETEAERALAARVTELETKMGFVLAILDEWNDERPGDLSTPDKVDFRRRLQEAKEG